MRILIIGGGGREHALAWKLEQSARCEALFCAPGNPGIARHATCVDLKLSGGFEDVIAFCAAEKIGLVVVGPERPLAEGIVDALEGAGIKAFGPRREAAQLESSKRFAKELMAEAGIPTARAETFTALEPALAYLAGCALPIVIKAAGLAEGKGVTVARTREEAQGALRACFEGAFGAAGNEVLIEDFLAGEEASLLAFADGTTVRAMDSAQDYKPLLDGDAGPNTGGMGTYSPAPVVTEAVRERAIRRVLEPCLAALRARGIDYRGVIYAGLMIDAAGEPWVIEFNCRFGDPETQVLLPRLENDLAEVMLACCEGRLGEMELKWKTDAAVCVVAASGGYPGTYAKGKVILGLDGDAGEVEEMIFHAGTALNAQGEVVTNGGRVLGVTATAGTLRGAIEKAYARLDGVCFEGMHARGDIGQRALSRVE